MLPTSVALCGIGITLWGWLENNRSLICPGVALDVISELMD